MYSKRYCILLLLIIVGATAASHGWSLADGLFFDDHWHQIRYRDDPWSLRALLEATTIEPGRFMQAWWQEIPVKWQYTRPVAILIAKSVYHLTDGSVKALHAVSVLAHLAAAFLVHHFCLRLTRRRFWSIVGALLFVFYSHGVYAVGWLAAQNTVLATAFMLAALACYVKASGLNIYAGSLNGAAIEYVKTDAPALKRLWFVLAVVLWFLALGSRESAIVLPLLAAAFDACFGGRRWLRARWGGYALMLIAAAGFVWWRLVVVYCPMPEFYFRRPDGAGYILWLIVKLMHYLTAVVWQSPMTVGPTGRHNPVVETPGDCLLMLAILTVMGTWYYQATRNARGWWIWPMWIGLGILPVVPLMATPHSGYLPGVGFAIGMVVGAALRDEIKPIGIGRWCRPVALGLTVATVCYFPIYRTMWKSVMAAERLTVARITASPPARQVTDLFFLNLPFANVYIQPHLREYWPCNAQDDAPGPAGGFRCHALTYASNVLRMEQPCRLEQIDAHSFSLTVEQRPWFSGALGRFLIEGMRSSGPLREGQRVKGRLFDVEIVRADTQGVWEMVFRFEQPLADDRYQFYLTTQDHVATPVRFRAPTDRPEEEARVSPDLLHRAAVATAGASLRAGQATPAETLFVAMEGENDELKRLAWEAFQPVARVLSDGLASPVRELILSNDPPSGPTLNRIRAWWSGSVDDRVLDAVWVRRDDFSVLRQARDALFAIRDLARLVIRTDLYQTGDWYPGPD